MKPVVLSQCMGEHLVGVGVLPALVGMLQARNHKRCVLVTDTNVEALWGAKARSALGARCCQTAVLEAGEEYKNLASIGELYRVLAEVNLQRQDAVVCLGGGVVGDMGGFAASTFKRGIAVYQVPSTLLAMVDSSIGGKTGFDLAQGKNLVGTFHLPSGLLTDVELLTTLPPRQAAAGFAEVVKTAMIGAPQVLATLERWLTGCGWPPGVIAQIPLEYEDRRCFSLPGGSWFKLSQMAWIVEQAAAVKEAIVVEDPREQSVRVKLNLGHTFGHALEAATGYSQLTHGEAVAIGIIAALKLASYLKVLEEPLEFRIINLLTKLGLPTRIPAGVSWDVFREVLGRDKKMSGSGYTFVLPRRLGVVEKVADLGLEQIKSVFVGMLS